MSKAIIRIGYDNYVMDTADALKIAEAMAKAERYKDVWRRTEDGGATYHIWEQDEVQEFTIRPIPDNVYRLYKLAGKPQE